MCHARQPGEAVVTIRTLHEVELFDEIAPLAGILSWTVKDNTLVGDSAVADLFRLEPTETLAGLPLQAYFYRVHPLDRPILAKVISDTFLGQMPQPSANWGLGSTGEYNSVVACGRVFRDRNGSPVVYSGIIPLVTEGEQQPQPHQYN